jgi:hypothetical protein
MQARLALSLAFSGLAGGVGHRVNHISSGNQIGERIAAAKRIPITTGISSPSPGRLSIASLIPMEGALKVFKARPVGDAAIITPIALVVFGDNLPNRSI